MFRHVTSNEHGNFLIGNLVDAFIVVDNLALVGEVPLHHETAGILGLCTFLDFLEPIKQRKVSAIRGSILHYINQVNFKRLTNVIYKDIRVSEETGNDITSFIDIHLFLIDARFITESHYLFQTSRNAFRPFLTFLAGFPTTSRLLLTILVGFLTIGRIEMYSGFKHLGIRIIPIASTARHRSIASNHLIDCIEEHRVISTVKYRIDNR